MDIAVFGLGYVGSVTAACLAAAGHHVVGIDTDPYKVRCIEEGRSPVQEEGLQTYLWEARQRGTLRVSTDVHGVLAQTEMALLCVGTPSLGDGRVNLAFLERVCMQIGESLIDRKEPYTVVVRSTVPPGTCEHVLIPLIEQTSGKQHGQGFNLCANPEFLREGSAVDDFLNPSLIVIGAQRPQTAQQVARLYDHLGKPCHYTDLRTAEMVKYVSNAFHALKITFANEIAAWCKQEGVDSHLLMRLFAADTKLNISATYLKPGFAFGGSCLPKDLRALLERAREHQLRLPLLEAILPSNSLQVERAAQLILQLGRQPVGVIGLTFKPGTDDVRESPVIALCKILRREGVMLRLHDPRISPDTVYGSNREFLLRELDHVEQWWRTDPSALIRECPVVVLATHEPCLHQHLAAIQEHQVVVDLIRALSPESIRGRYIGLYW